MTDRHRSTAQSALCKASRSKNDGHTFLLESEIFREVSTLVVAAQHEERRRVQDFQRPQVQHTLHQSKHTAINTLTMYRSLMKYIAFQSHDIIQRQITRKWYKIAIVTLADQFKVAYGLSNGAIFNDLERPLT